MNNFGMDFQGDGGGFAPSNGFGGGSPSGGGGGGGGGGSQDSGQKRPKRNYDEQTTIPVTLQMVLSARQESAAGGEGGLVLDDGRPVHTVKFVAAVRSAEDQSTNVMYVLEDGTASMDVKQWLDDNDPSVVSELRQQTARDGVYVKVVGQIKDYENRKQIIANTIRPLSSGNELTHHMLDVVYSAEKFKRDNSIVPPMMPVPAGHSLINDNNNNNMGMGMNNNMGGNAAGGGGSVKGLLMDVFRNNDNGSEEGLSIYDCFQFLPDVPEAELRKAIMELSEDGDIYSTISENHYRLAQ